MEPLHLSGTPPITIALRRSPRARRLSLRVSRLDGQVTLSLPPGASRAQAESFAQTRAGWLRSVLAAQPEAVRVRIGGALPLEGRMHRLLPGEGRAVQVAEGALHVPGDPTRAGPRLAAWLKCLARERLATACDSHARALGVDYTGLRLRDVRSRWGSCGSDGGLMFSWRLVMAPPAVLDYVAAHEVAHRRQMNHSPAFWALVTRLCPGWKAQRDWLRREGPGLHRWRFEPGADVEAESALPLPGEGVQTRRPRRAPW